ncbi:MAG: hypothetical protein A2Y38_10085 [Spirochaetes bacterium GWB1_59_5]|nr:MAG: hypothetical protein A2Y38_10085 [Spirochaetes bacterium GWB1_59_5]
MPPTPGQIKKIHALKNALGMDDDTYREALKAYKVKSSTRLSIVAADTFIADLESKAVHAGVWEKRPAKAAFPRVPSPESRVPKLADDAQSKKIRALWLELHQAGKIANPSEPALAAYCKRMTKVDRLEWLKVWQASALIETMKKWLER